MGRGVYRSYYKGHKDKIKGEGRGGGGRWDWKSVVLLYCVRMKVLAIK